MQRLFRRAGRASSAAVLLALVAACGSTVPVRDVGVGSDGLGRPLGSPDAPVGEDVLGRGPAKAGAYPGPSPEHADPSGTAASRTPVPGSGQQAPVGRVAVRGVTSRTITLGVLVSTNNSQAAKSAGFAVDTGDAVKQVEALRSWVNAHGGIAGRRVELVYHDRDATSTQSPDVQTQAACDAFTVDHKVYAVMTFFVGFGIAPCLASRQTALVDTSVVGWLDSAAYRKLGPYYFTPDTMAMDRYAEAYVDGLARLGYFAGRESRFGLVYGDTPEDRRVVRQVLEPALAKRGVRLTGSFGVTPAITPDGAAAQSGQVQNAILRFRSDRVDHVMFLYPASATLFMVSAQGQGFTPRYGLGTYDSPSTTQGLVPARQLQGAVGVGFMPAGDVAAAQQGGTVSAKERLCLEIMRRAGLQASSQAARLSMLAHCEMFFFTQRVLDGTRDISPVGFAAAAEGLEPRYESTLTFGVRITRDRHDGPSFMRPFAFDGECSCFRYSARPYSIG